jgi:hypothetical protein
MAVRAVSTALFGHATGSEADIMAAMGQATPDQLAELKKIDADFKIQMKSLDIDLDKIAADDRDSARKMQTEVRDWIPRALAIGVTLGFFGIMIWILAFGLPNDGKEALLLLLGALQTAWGGIIAFYFGSSSGSQKKDQLLFNSTPVNQ